jgi:hypothetical protein
MKISAKGIKPKNADLSELQAKYHRCGCTAIIYMDGGW